MQARPPTPARSTSTFPREARRAAPTHRGDALAHKELVGDQSQGVQLGSAQALAEYWLDEYDCGRIAERLNALPQFVTEIDGVDVHFVHVRSEHEDALPLIMTHGWPGSVIEQLDTVGPLTDPDRARRHAPRTPSTSSCPPCPATASPASRPSSAGTSTARTGLGRADAAPRVHPLCRPGRRRRCRRHRCDGPPGSGGPARHPHQPAGAALNNPAALPSVTELRASGARRDQEVPDERQRLLRGAVHPAADHRLRAAGLARVTRGLDGGPRHHAYYKIAKRS